MSKGSNEQPSSDSIQNEVDDFADDAEHDLRDQVIESRQRRDGFTVLSAKSGISKSLARQARFEVANGRSEQTQNTYNKLKSASRTILTLHSFV